MFGRKNPSDQQPPQPDPSRDPRDPHAPHAPHAPMHEPRDDSGFPTEPEFPADTGEDADAALERLRAERDDFNDKYLRALAEFQNYQRRAFNNEKEARQQGVSSVLNSILPVMDHFDMALTLDPAKASAQQVIDGVKVIRGELLKALQACGITLINPGPNDEFNPGQHQAITQMPGEGVEPGRIVSTFQPGYMLGERVVRPAKVIVAP